MFPSGLLSADTLSSTAEWGQRHDARCPIGAGRLAEGASRTETPHTWGRHAWRAPRVNARPRCSLVFTQPVPAIVCARSDDMLRQITRAYMPAHFFFCILYFAHLHTESLLNGANIQEEMFLSARLMGFPDSYRVRSFGSGGGEIKPNLLRDPF